MTIQKLPFRNYRAIQKLSRFRNYRAIQNLSRFRNFHDSETVTIQKLSRFRNYHDSETITIQLSRFRNYRDSETIARFRNYHDSETIAIQKLSRDSETITIQKLILGWRTSSFPNKSSSEQDNLICHARFFRDLLICFGGMGPYPKFDLFCVLSSPAQI